MDANEQITFIIENVNELQISDRRNVLQLLFDAGSELKETGSGSQIRIGDLPDDLINEIHKRVRDKIDEQLNILKAFEL
jgi:hypothetical protein